MSPKDSHQHTFLPSVVIGAGGHSRTVVSVLQSLDLEVLGLLDTKNHQKENVLGAPIIGDKVNYSRYLKNHNLYIALGDNYIRKEYYEVIKKKGGSLPSLSHPDANIHTSVSVGLGSLVANGSMLCPKVTIGDNCIINSRALLEHDVIIGDHVHIAPDASLAGKVTIAEGVFVGMKSTVKDGVKIGAWAKVGAGSVVVDNIPAGAVVAGNPARIISMKESGPESKKETALIQENASLLEAMEKIDYTGGGYAIALNDSSQCVGILTDGSIRREMIAGAQLVHSIKDLIQRDYFFLREDKEYEALHHFSYLIKFIPILDHDNHLVKVIHHEDIMAKPPQGYDDISRKVKHVYRYYQSDKKNDYSYEDYLKKLSEFTKHDISCVASRMDDLRKDLLCYLKNTADLSQLYCSPYLKNYWLKVIAEVGLACLPLSRYVSGTEGVLLLSEYDDLTSDDKFSSENKIVIIKEQGGLNIHPTEGCYCILIRMSVNDEINAEGAGAVIINEDRLENFKVPSAIHPMQIASSMPDVDYIDNHRALNSSCIENLKVLFPEIDWRDAYAGGVLGLLHHQGNIIKERLEESEYDVIESGGQEIALLIKDPYSFVNNNIKAKKELRS
ncbi:MAG: NeuD/PglB/VioB family sugar acetyltransferase [Planctomycetes bacterium]|nr:NeuD/PglB/VioB family sugar acetyltransferase [Planctomycetota bacterium]